MKFNFWFFSTICSSAGGNYSFCTYIKNNLSPNLDNFQPVNSVTSNAYGNAKTKDLGYRFTFFMKPNIYNYFNILASGSGSGSGKNFINTLIEKSSHIAIPEVKEDWGEVINEFKNHVIPSFNQLYPNVPITDIIKLAFSKSDFWVLFRSRFCGFNNIYWHIENPEQYLRKVGSMLCIYTQETDRGWEVVLNNTRVFPQEDAKFISSLPGEVIQTYEPISFYYWNFEVPELFQS